MGKYFLTLSALVSALQPFPTNIADVPIGNQIASSSSIIVVEKTAEITDNTAPKIATTTAWITAYSSSHDETDDTPFVTAYMTDVRDGIVATNMFPFGTKIQIPKLFGEKIFIVEDKMHRRKKNFIDIWMPSKNEAIKFGIYQTEIVVWNDK